MTELQREIIHDLLYMELDLGTPTFNFNGVTYPFVSSISSFQRELETGGYSVMKLLSCTVRVLNEDGSPQFATMPTAQQIIRYNVDGLDYRVESVKLDPTRSHFRMVAVGTARGI